MPQRFACLVGVFLLSLLCISCCFRGLRASVKAYHGDGNIFYKKGPLLGRSGCVIRFPAIDLSQPTDVEYSLDGIPQNDRSAGGLYFVYLVQPYTDRQVYSGMFSFELRKNGASVRKVSSRISDMQNSQENGCNRFYIMEGADWLDGALYIDDSTSHWSIVISSRNDELKESTKAHIELCRGGFK